MSRTDKISSQSRVLVVDDIRMFAFPAMYARTARAALARLSAPGAHFTELWLDHDLGEAGDVRRVVNYLERRAFEGRPVPVGRVLVQSDNPNGATWIVAALARHYDVRRVATFTG